MIKRTLHYLWGKKFAILILALVLILLPNTIGHGMQVLSTTVITQMTIEQTGDTIHITAEKFKPGTGEDKISFESVDYTGTDVRQMLANTSLAHCTNLQFVGTPDLDILHALYHYQDLRGNTTVNHEKTMNELLRNYDETAH